MRPVQNTRVGGPEVLDVLDLPDASRARLSGGSRSPRPASTDRATPGRVAALARTLRSINSIESMMSIACNHSMDVKNRQDGNMALGWCAAGMLEARGQFCRVNGYLHLPALRAALDAHVAARTVGAAGQDEPVIAT
jgi:hypothetical protein